MLTRRLLLLTPAGLFLLPADADARALLYDGEGSGGSAPEAGEKTSMGASGHDRYDKPHGTNTAKLSDFMPKHFSATERELAHHNLKDPIGQKGAGQDDVHRWAEAIRRYDKALNNAAEVFGFGSLLLAVEYGAPGAELMLVALGIELPEFAVAIAVMGVLHYVADQVEAGRDPFNADDAASFYEANRDDLNEKASAAGQDIIDIARRERVGAAAISLALNLGPLAIEAYRSGKEQAEAAYDRMLDAGAAQVERLHREIYNMTLTPSYY